VVAGARVGVHAETLSHHALALLDRRVEQRLLASLAVQHAFGLRNDHFGSAVRRCHRFLDSVLHLGDVVGAVDLAHPLHADAAYRIRIECLVLRSLFSLRDEGMSCPPVAAE